MLNPVNKNNSYNLFMMKIVHLKLYMFLFPDGIFKKRNA